MKSNHNWAPMKCRTRRQTSQSSSTTCGLSTRARATRNRATATTDRLRSTLPHWKMTWIAIPMRTMNFKASMKMLWTATRTMPHRKPHSWWRHLATTIQVRWGYLSHRRQRRGPATTSIRLPTPTRGNHTHPSRVRPSNHLHKPKQPPLRINSIKPTFSVKESSLKGVKD